MGKGFSTMFNLYLTPASISYLNQFLLALLNTIYLGRRIIKFRKQKPAQQDLLLLVFFNAITLYSLLIFLEVSFLPTARLYVVYLENSVIALLLVALIQFAYAFPVPDRKQNIERWIAFILTMSYFAWEAVTAVSRYQLLGDGDVVFREPIMDRPLIWGFGWTLIVFIRGAIRNWKLPASRRFPLVFIIPVWLAFLNERRAVYAISTPFYHINMSVGILFALLVFTLVYLTSQPEKTSFSGKFSGIMLTSLLAVFGIVGWLIAPSYADRYVPNIPDQRTIQFTPDGQGGYELAEVPFDFDPDFGEDIMSVVSIADRTFEMPVQFPFPFLGREYQTIYISNMGALTMGENLDWKDLQYQFSHVPAILALLVDTDPARCSPDCGIYYRLETSQLLVTYYEVPSLNKPNAIYTFQIALQSDGSFTITYNGLPEPFQFFVDDRPETTAWALGIKPEHAPLDSVDYSRLPLHSGADGLLQDEYRTFRAYLDDFLQPVAIAILAGSLLILVLLTILFRYGVARPLDALLQGVQALNSGRRDISIPVKYNDEIGFLTGSFNKLSSELNGLITDLQARIDERTSDLIAANEALHESEVQYRNLFNLESDALFIAREEDGCILEANKAAAEMYGYSQVQLAQMKFPELSIAPAPMDDHQLPRRSPERVIQIPLCWHRKMNGEIFPVDIKQRSTTWKGEAVTISAVRDITLRIQAEQELERLAITDPLTGVFNRRYFFSESERIFSHSKHPPYSLAVLMVDLDNFKNVNDRYGHAIGDQVLTECARRLEANLRPSDVFGRVGGEEFAILLPRTSREKACQIAERLRLACAEAPFAAGQSTVPVTISVGVACLDGNISNLEGLLDRADQAVYIAKQAGRNCWAPWQAPGSADRDPVSRSGVLPGHPGE